AGGGPVPRPGPSAGVGSAAGVRGPRAGAARRARRPPSGLRRARRGARGALQPGGGDANDQRTRASPFAARIKSMNVLASIPSPASNGFYIGPLFFHAYGIAYVFAVAAAVYISRWRWARVGGDPDLCYEIAMWGFPAGLIGGGGFSRALT